MSRPNTPLTILTVTAMAFVTFGVSMLVVFSIIAASTDKLKPSDTTRGIDVPAIERFESLSASPPKYVE